MNQMVAFSLRDHQREVHSAASRFSCVVMHRRAGKSVYCVAKLIEAASQHPDSSGQYHYVGPTQKQTRAIAWKYAVAMAGTLPGVTVHVSDLRITFPSGTTLELLGVENIDSLRGRYSNGVVLDESQLMPTSHWTYVIRPLLADRKGWALVTGTPAGRHNLLGWSFKQDDWYVKLLPCDETNALDPEELDSMRKGMSPEAWSQEMECSFNAALQGAYYASEIDQLERDGRLTQVRYDKSLPVVAALDLGHRDLMPVIWYQQAGTEYRIIKCKAYQFTAIPDMLGDWEKLDWRTSHVVLPHDARVRELGSGKTRQEVFHEFNYPTTIAPKQSLDEGIEAVRLILPNVWLDKDEASTLFEALGSYRSEYDEDRQVFKVTPLHDWSSHYADAMRYLAQGRPTNTGGWGPRQALTGGVYA